MQFRILIHKTAESNSHGHRALIVLNMPSFLKEILRHHEKMF